MFGTLFGFGGRLSRAGFIEALFSILLIDVALIIGQKYVESDGLPGGYGPGSQLASGLVAAAPWVIGAFTLWGLLATAVKRCHDRGRPGVLLLLLVVPIVGWLWLFVDLVVLMGNKGANRYGRAPHGHETVPDLWRQPAPAGASAAAVADDHAAHAHPIVEDQGQAVEAVQTPEAVAAPEAAPEAEAVKATVAAPDPGRPAPDDDAHLAEAQGRDEHGSDADDVHAHEQSADAAPSDNAQGHDDRVQEALPVVAQVRTEDNGAIPAFVQRWATVYYDPTPPKRDLVSAEAPPAPGAAPVAAQPDDVVVPTPAHA